MLFLYLYAYAQMLVSMWYFPGGSWWSMWFITVSIHFLIPSTWQLVQNSAIPPQNVIEELPKRSSHQIHRRVSEWDSFPLMFSVPFLTPSRYFIDSILRELKMKFFRKVFFFFFFWNAFENWLAFIKRAEFRKSPSIGEKTTEKRDGFVKRGGGRGNGETKKPWILIKIWS